MHVPVNCIWDPAARKHTLALAVKGTMFLFLDIMLEGEASKPRHLRSPERVPTVRLFDPERSMPPGAGQSLIPTTDSVCTGLGQEL